MISKVLYLSLMVLSAQSFSPQHSLLPTRNSHNKDGTTKDVKTSTCHAMSAISDAEALLAKARALREQAEAEEHKLHTNLIEKKNCQNVATDNVIQNLFPIHEMINDVNDKNDPQYEKAKHALAHRMDSMKLSTNMLENVVERLHEREIAARGLEHVEPTTHHDQVKFVRVAAPQEEELARVQGLIQRLIDAAEVLDEEYLKHGKDQNHHHVDSTHWSRGKLAKVLNEKAHFLGREHDEEFKKRLEEFYEAARKKKDQDGTSFKMY